MKGFINCIKAKLLGGGEAYIYCPGISAVVESGAESPKSTTIYVHGAGLSFIVAGSAEKVMSAIDAARNSDVFGVPKVGYPAPMEFHERKLLELAAAYNSREIVGGYCDFNAMLESSSAALIPLDEGSKVQIIGVKECDGRAMVSFANGLERLFAELPNESMVSLTETVIDLARRDLLCQHIYDTPPHVWFDIANHTSQNMVLAYNNAEGLGKLGVSSVDMLKGIEVRVYDVKDPYVAFDGHIVASFGDSSDIAYYLDVDMIADWLLRHEDAARAMLPEELGRKVFEDLVWKEAENG